MCPFWCGHEISGDIVTDAISTFYRISACELIRSLSILFSDTVIPSERYVDPPPPATTAANASSCGGHSVQMRTAHYQAADTSCSIQLQGDAFNDTQTHFGGMTFHNNNNNNNHSIGGGSVYNINPNNQNNNNNNKSSGSGSSLSPSHSFPLNWYYGLSSDADYYGHGTVGFNHCSQQI